MNLKHIKLSKRSKKLKECMLQDSVYVTLFKENKSYLS